MLVRIALTWGKWTFDELKKLLDEGRSPWGRWDNPWVRKGRVRMEASYTRVRDVNGLVSVRIHNGTRTGTVFQRMEPILEPDPTWNHFPIFETGSSKTRRIRFRLPFSISFQEDRRREFYTCSLLNRCEIARAGEEIINNVLFWLSPTPEKK